MVKEKLCDLEVSERERKQLVQVGRKMGYTESGTVSRAIKEFLAKHEDEL
jgi:hypothetical protein